MMKTKQNTTTVKTAAVAVIAALIMITSAYAGDLEPSAPPAAGGTMKTLDEVEPRIPVNDDTAPGDIYYEHVISSSGSYYLTGDVNTAKGGIQITANNVTLDLCGYNIIGDAGNNGTGLELDSQSNVEVRNGTVRNFGYEGVRQNYVSATDHRVINIRSIDNGQAGGGIGIYVHGTNHLVKDCIASGNSSYGFYVPGSSSTITGCKSYNNTNSGFYTGNGCTVQNNTAYGNGNTGIYVGGGCTVKSNTAYDNNNSGIYVNGGGTVKDNTAYSNQTHGISTNAYCTIINNTVKDNNYDGINAGSGSTVTGNTVSGNGDDGIYVNSYGVITGNSVHYSEGNGIKAGSDSIVSGNVLRGNNVSEADYGGIYVYADCLVKGNNLSANQENNIYVHSSDNAIEENLVTDCTTGASGYGIFFATTGNFYANNRASGNSTNYGGSVPAGSGDGGGNAEF